MLSRDTQANLAVVACVPFGFAAIRVTLLMQPEIIFHQGRLEVNIR